MTFRPPTNTTIEQRVAIRRADAAKVPHAVIAEEHGLSIQDVHTVVWRFVTGR